MNTQKSYGMGKHVILEECPKMAQDKLNALSKLDERAAERAFLRSVTHGHSFSRFTRTCELCGMSEAKYMMMRDDERRPCRIGVPTPPQTAAGSSFNE